MVILFLKKGRKRKQRNRSLGFKNRSSVLWRILNCSRVPVLQKKKEKANTKYKVPWRRQFLFYMFKWPPLANFFLFSVLRQTILCSTCTRKQPTKCTSLLFARLAFPSFAGRYINPENFFQWTGTQQTPLFLQQTRALQCGCAVPVSRSHLIHHLQRTTHGHVSVKRQSLSPFSKETFVAWVIS